MKLIHRLQLELVSADNSEGKSLTVTASFYRPFLDGGYQTMIIGMMDSGCFDGFMRSIIDQLVQTGICKFPLAIMLVGFIAISFSIRLTICNGYYRTS